MTRIYVKVARIAHKVAHIAYTVAHIAYKVAHIAYKVAHKIVHIHWASYSVILPPKTMEITPVTDQYLP